MTEGLIKYRKRFLEDWFDFNGTAMFLILCLVYFALLFVKKVFIIDSIAAFEILNERGDMWVFDIIYNIQYLSIPVFLTWKFLWTTLFLWIGCFMFGYRLHFNKLYKLVMLLEIFFFLPEILKIIWFTLFFSDPDYNDYMAFYPFSLINLVDYTQIEPNWHYPLKSLNIFEILYWPLMILGVYFLSGKSLKISTYIVSSSYVLFFLIWLVFYVIVY
ncbi:MAG: hypothetical protein AB8B73_07995 [Ekhidna sp.]